MPKDNRFPNAFETGQQVTARPHDTGSQANETMDGLDATTEAIRHAAEDTPTGTGPGDIEKTPPRGTDPWRSVVRVFPSLAGTPLL